MCIAIISIMLPFHALGAQFSTDPDAIEQAAKSVLMIEVYDKDAELMATGSGFVAFNNRTLVTNYHVIENADWMIANSDDGYRYMVTKILITDQEKDIAICEFMSPTDLTPLMMNSDGDLKRAQSVVAIGNPLGTIIGTTNTVSIGNISALYDDGTEKWIQFTAPISHGSSGGALFDDQGKVIGMTSAFLNDAQNMNLAIHISEIQNLYEMAKEPAMYFEEYFIGLNATPKPINSPTPTPSARPTNTPTPQPVPKPIIIPIATPAPTLNPIPTSMPVPTSIPRPTPTPVPYKELKKGDKGEEVRELQDKLIELGYLDGTADGVFGSKTEEAVILCNWHVYGAINKKTATNLFQQQLFAGEIPAFAEKGMTLCIPDGQVQTNIESGDAFQVRFQVNSRAERKEIKAFECYAYTTDERGEKVIDTATWTTYKRVRPGETTYSDYITLDGFSKMKHLYVGVRKIIYTDGTVFKVAKKQIDYKKYDKM